MQFSMQALEIEACGTAGGRVTDPHVAKAPATLDQSLCKPQVSKHVLAPHSQLEGSLSGQVKGHCKQQFQQP